jgi:hypothetical protein
MMKKFASMFAIALMGGTMFISSCSDDDDQPSRADMLTAKSWIITSAELEFAGQRIPYTDGAIEDCALDDVITFTKDGKYAQVTGTKKCYTGEEGVTGTWQLKNGDKILAMTETGETEADESEITAMTSTRIEIFVEEFQYDSNGDGKNDVTAKL